MLHTDILCSAKKIDSNLTVPELDMIAKVYKKFTNKDLKFKVSDCKAIKVNKISAKFGDTLCISPKKKKLHTPLSLSALSRN